MSYQKKQWDPKCLQCPKCPACPTMCFLRSWVSASTCHKDGLVSVRSSLSRNLQVWNKPAT